MITDLTISDNAGTVVSRINAAIEEQNKGVDTLGANPNAGTVISRVHDAIDAEGNNQLYDVTSSDNAADFIRKVNALFASINAGGGEEPGPGPDPEPEPDYAYWNGKKYIAFGDSLTHTGWQNSWPPYLNERYCYLVSMPTVPVNEGDYEGLGMVFTNKGISGSMMLYNGAFSYSTAISTGRVENPQRSFAYELLDPDKLIAVTASDARGPYGVDLSQYDLITLMFGTNDINRIYMYQNYPNAQPQEAEIGQWGDTDLKSFYGAYKRALDYIRQNTDAVVVICVPPKCTDPYFKIDRIEGVIRDIASKYDPPIPIVDFYNNCTVDLKSDGVHPSTAGQKVMADYFKLRLGEIAAELHLSDN